MSCSFKYAELFRETNPELADSLTQKGLKVWGLIKDSKLFKEKNGKYSLASKTTAKRQKQIEFIDSLGDFVYLDGEDVVVDLSKVNDLQTGSESRILYQKENNAGIIASEKTIRDLAARMSYRIGIPVKFESDRSKEYKGKLEHGTAVINLAYATLDTIFHEVLSHPIIRVLKNKSEKSINDEIDKMIEQGIIIKDC